MINPIEVKNIYKNYSDKNAVNGINFSVSDNEIVGLLGPNGCGKTTTIAIMLGLLRASSGQVFIKGKDIDIVVLCLGANDMLRGINPSLIKQNLNKILEKLEKNNADLDASKNDYKRLLRLNEHINGLFRERIKKIKLPKNSKKI